MGKVALNPFVYVRKKNDTIYVIASNDTTTIKKYFYVITNGAVMKNMNYGNVILL